MERLRYTGCWPPVDVLQRYPNWVYALDEEEEPDQDETSIRPEDQQSFISNETVFTAGIAMCPEGRELSVVFSAQEGDVEGFEVFDGRDWWLFRVDENGRDWFFVSQDWLPEMDGRAPDLSLFPLRVSARLPDMDGRALTFVVRR